VPPRRQINLKTANDLGIDIPYRPPSSPAREVIE
jgi:hypothetical protein